MNAITITESSHDNESPKATQIANEGIALGSAKYQHVRPHDYQTRLTEEILTILETSQHAYLESPTATGKTLVLALIADQLGIADVYYLVATTELVEQTKRDIESMIYAGLINPKTKWHFMTWKAYVVMAKRRANDDALPIHLALVDECHIGGVKSWGPAKVSFPIIKESATKVVWISATPWNLDEAIMGTRDGCTAYYSYNEAFQRGLMNPTELIRVDCSLNMKIQIGEGKANVKSLFNAQNNALTIAAETAEETFDQLQQRVKAILGRPMRTTDAPALVTHRYRIMAQIYKERHIGEKAIFWLPNKRHAAQCAAYLNELFDSPNYAATFLGNSKKSIEEQQSHEALKVFRDPKGDIKIMCVVYRLRAGFDYPQLANGFDCAWNPYNYRNAVQKIGRLVRTAALKRSSNYYYAVDAIAIAAAANRNFSSKFLGGLASSYSDEDLNMTAHALADAKALDHELRPNQVSTKSMPTLHSLEISGVTIRSVSTPLFDVHEATGSIERLRVDMVSMFRDSTATRLELLVSGIEEGNPAPKRGTADHAFLFKYINKNSVHYDETIRARVMAKGAYVPRQAVQDRRQKNLEIAIRIIESDPSQWIPGTWPHDTLKNSIFRKSPQYRDDLRQRLIKIGVLKPLATQAKIEISPEQQLEIILASRRNGVTRDSEIARVAFCRKYTRLSSPYFNATFRQRLIEAGALRAKECTRKRNDKLEERLKIAIDIATKSPNDWKDDPDARILKNYINTSSKRFRPDIRQTLIKAGALSERSADLSEKLETMISSIEKGEIHFNSKTFEYKYLASYFSPSSKTYNPAIRDRLVAAGKFSRKLTDEKIEDIVRQIEAKSIEFKPGTIWYIRLASYYSRHSPLYREELRQRLVNAGYLRGRTRPGTISEVMDQIENNTLEFKPGTKAYIFLSRYFSPSGDAYDPVIREKLIKIGKLKPRKNVSKQHKD